MLIFAWAILTCADGSNLTHILRDGLEGKAIAMADFENRLIEFNSSEDRNLLRRDFEFVTRRMKDLIEEQNE